MENDLVKIDTLIVKQAVRDVASKDTKTSQKALSYFISNDFKNLCQRNNFDVDKITLSIKNLNEYPLLSRKKLSNDIAKMIDSIFI
jgi:Asp-tRNA(Asn)/Glu-tRNA(Gln) amidotransferase B subunit|tara:strand:- start:164 stop:421 length:258 start_codon:yes stop_codon:yes gene_type:complete